MNNNLDNMIEEMLGMAGRGFSGKEMTRSTRASRAEEKPNVPMLKNGEPDDGYKEIVLRYKTGKTPMGGETVEDVKFIKKQGTEDGMAEDTMGLLYASAKMLSDATGGAIKTDELFARYVKTMVLHTLDSVKEILRL